MPRLCADSAVVKLRGTPLQPTKDRARNTSDVNEGFNVNLAI